MEFAVIIDMLAGPLGGVFAFGVAAGGVLTHIFVSPQVYKPQISALSDRIAILEEEIRPFREFRDRTVQEVMHPRTRS